MMKRLQSNVVVVVATNSKMVYVTLRSPRELPKEVAVEAWNCKAGRSKGNCKRQKESPLSFLKELVGLAQTSAVPFR